MTPIEKADTIYLTIVAPKDGGIVIYEQSNDGEAAPVFGGNLDDATKYFNKRTGELQRRVQGDGKVIPADRPISARPLPLGSLNPPTGDNISAPASNSAAA